ncbi:Pre-mRNA-splicing factor sap61 [Coemansia sp. Benny D115]|nr:Pre-mRNA-splicing factor sap61 [Coemansia sp. Benny D115]
MDSIIEQQRQAHEEIERLEQAIADMMLQDLNKHRYKLAREQKISELLDQTQTLSKLILDLEADESGLRYKETNDMAEHQLSCFYSRIGDIRTFHRHNPDVTVVPPELKYLKYKQNPEEVQEKQKAQKMRQKELLEAENSADVPLEEELPVVQTFVSPEDEIKLDMVFSGDERLGRYVDLNEQHELYLNLADAQRLTYLDYLAQFSQFEQYPRKNKCHTQYTSYLDSIDAYFKGFFSRSKPLYDLASTLNEAEEAFEKQWTRNEVLGWEAAAEQKYLCEVCNKEFEKDTTYNAHMNSRKHQKAAERAKTQARNTDTEGQQKSATERRLEREKHVAWIECKIRTYTGVLSDVIRDTRANVERRQALTEEERAQEMNEEEVEYVDNKEDKDDQIYNPLNLPMGWDGKPIPYWLYKLHGLGVKFVCEICGNSTYRGRKAYEKHFQEARHATNMRRLGIPNTKQFYGVALIAEAQSLWERIQKEKKQEVANADIFEEYEDSEGNVYNKKTYLDLKRQGLI